MKFYYTFHTLLFLLLVKCLQSFVKAKESAALYSEDDDVVILNGDNFKANIFNSKYLWLVEFYSAWCGHCQHFAPTYKALATNVKEWQGIIKLAVINCPDEGNTDLCREMDLSGYPTMRFFKPFSNSSSKGIELISRKSDNMIEEIVKTIELNIEEFKWDDQKTNKLILRPISFDEFMDFGYGKTPNYYRIFIFEEANSTLGKQIILDASSCFNMTVHRVDALSADGIMVAKKLQIDLTSLPVAAALTKDGNINTIDVDLKRRSFFTYKLQRLPGVHKSEFKKAVTIMPPVSELPNIHWSEVDMSKTYIADIESSIHYAFTNEISASRVLENDKLKGLKEYLMALSLLANHLPLLPSTSNFIKRMQQWVDDKTQIVYSEYDKEIFKKENNDFIPEANKHWVGCLPSRPGKRGYPCSLWTFFHTLTVAAYNANVKDVTLVPKAIYSYITNFFSCKDCRENFKKEVAKLPYPSSSDSKPKHTVLWLWKLHNSVNERLHNDVSEDPVFPKIEFPSKKYCPQCYDNQDNWIEDAVFTYLVTRYSKNAVSHEYLTNFPTAKVIEKPETQRHEENYFNVMEAKLTEEYYDPDADIANEHIAKAVKERKGDDELMNEKLFNRIKNHPLDIDDEFGGRKSENEFHPRNVNYKNEGFILRLKSSLGFSSLDTGLCIGLWCFSIIAVVVVYFFIRLKRKYRMRKFRIH